MRILYLNQWFDPEPFAKTLPFVKELQRQGHQVEVLTGFPNYPGGKVYPGYRIRPFKREIMDGVPVIRVALYPSHDRSAFRRVLNYVSFSLSAAILGPFLVRRPDVIYTRHPAATIAFPALILKLLKRVPVVYDIEDLWPDTLSSTGMMREKIILDLVSIWCRMTYRLVDHITVVSPGMKATLVKRGVPTWKVDIIHAWCNEYLLKFGDRIEKESLPEAMRGRFNILFAGNIGFAQALDAVLDAGILLRKGWPAIQFVILGDGIDLDRLKGRTRDEHIDNILFLPRRPMKDMGSILRKADALLVHLKHDPLFHIAIPSKTQAYMAMGRPLLMAVEGDGAELVSKADAGITCVPENPESISQAAVELYQTDPMRLKEMGRNAENYYRENLSLKSGTQKFIQIFEEVVHGNH